jgi:hypothetical protein
MNGVYHQALKAQPIMHGACMLTTGGFCDSSQVNISKFGFIPHCCKKQAAMGYELKARRNNEKRRY